MFGQIITLVSLIACIGLNVPFNVEKTIKYDEVVTTESIKQRNYQHTENVGNTVVTYKYETNEINTKYDIVEGNIYNLNIVDNTLDDMFNYEHEFDLYIVGDFYLDSNAFGYDEQTLTYGDLSPYNKFHFDGHNDTVFWYFGFGENFYASLVAEVSATISINCNCYFQFYGQVEVSDYFFNGVEKYLSSTDYNEILSVTYTEPTTIVGVINEFCENYLFKDIPLVSSMTFEIGGQSVNLMTWLVMLVGIALSIGILILLFVVFKWLFLLFAGIFKR